MARYPLISPHVLTLNTRQNTSLYPLCTCVPSIGSCLHCSSGIIWDIFMSVSKDLTLVSKDADCCIKASPVLVPVQTLVATGTRSQIV